MRVIFILLMLAGVLITIQTPFSRARVVALWSDFKQFEANATKLEGGRAVLALGGENPKESFQDLLQKLLDLQKSTAVSILGIVVFGLSASGLVLDLRRGKVESNRLINGMPPTRFPFSFRIAVIVGIAFVFIDVLPKFGAPYFRYTGGDPAHHVWNFGWPFTLAIYDSRSGFHIGPFLYVVLPFQILVVSVIAAVGMFRNRHNPSLQTTAATQSS